MDVRTAVFLMVLLVALTACATGGQEEYGRFRLSISPAQTTLVPDGTRSVTITIERSSGYSEPVKLSLETVPGDVTGTFRPNVVTGTRSTLMLSAASSAKVGSHVLMVRSQSDASETTISLPLRVEATLPLSTVEMDPLVKPRRPALSSSAGGEPRLLASVVDAKGRQSDFVENELIVVTDDASWLAAFLARWQGKVVRTIDPATVGLKGLKPIRLVRVNTSAADVAQLPVNLRKINPFTRGDARVSSNQGISLLAAAAEEAAKGSRVEINWITESTVFEDKISNEAASSTLGDDGLPVIAGYDRNVFTWSHMRIGSTQNIGVTEAWRALEIAGKLGNKILIAVVDTGFSVNADTPAGAQLFPDSSLMNTPGPDGKRFHGTWVAQTATAIPDNGFGTAGVAGPIANLAMVFVEADLFSCMLGVINAEGTGARIINMSFSADASAFLTMWASSGVGSFEEVTSAIRANGKLLFAAAGNNGVNVDAQSNPFWEDSWVTPCENDGVICVGGLKEDDNEPHPSSNWGPTVRLWAPIAVYVGGDFDTPTDEMRKNLGTSYASPFAAGVAALIWAANPSLTADQVEDLLFTWAHTTPGPPVLGGKGGDKYVNAISPVREVLGLNAPFIKILKPTADQHVGIGGFSSVTFEADVEDFLDPPNCCKVTWKVDGVPIGIGKTIQHQFTSPGLHLITATAENSKSETSSFVAVHAENSPPTVEILHPGHNQTLVLNLGETFKGIISDPNEPASIGCGSLVWTSSKAGDPTHSGTCTPLFTFGTLGQRTITLNGTDKHGAPAVPDQVTIQVAASADSAPKLSIIAPSFGALLDGCETGSSCGDITLAVKVVGGQPPYTFKWEVLTSVWPGVAVGTIERVPEERSEPGTRLWKPSEHLSDSNTTAFLFATVTDGAGKTGLDLVKIKIQWPPE